MTKKKVSADTKYRDGTTYKDSEGKTHKRVSYPGTKRGDAVSKNPNIIRTEGELFSCPGCDEPLLKFVRDIYDWEQLIPEMVEGIGFDISYSDGTLCPHCSKDYFLELLCGD
jgi:uncharacterized Zn-finger protein